MAYLTITLSQELLKEIKDTSKKVDIPISSIVRQGAILNLKKLRGFENE